jgi:arylsulfatase A-like enzyme
MVLPLLVAMLACGPTAEDSGAHHGPPTNTMPSFYGQVPSNLLFISIDTLRRDHLDRYGTLGITPKIDRLMSEGFSVDAHTQCSNWTYASTTCTLMGRYNLDAGFIPKLSGTLAEPVPQPTDFLATYLGRAGFHSILVSENSWMSPLWSNTQGYDYAHNVAFGFGEWVFEEGLRRLDRAQRSGQVGDHWFLHVHLMEPHAPYTPPPVYLDGLDALEPIGVDLASRDAMYSANIERGLWPAELVENYDAHVKTRYQGEIRWLDDQIEAMLTRADDLGVLDDTLVVVWSDHGEAFWDHGVQSHAWTLHAEENDAVLFFWAKNIVPGSWSEPTAAIDLVPTLLGLHDQPIPEQVTGLPIGSAAPDRPRFAYADARGLPEHAVMVGDMKLIYGWGGDVQLYDRAADPTEEDNLYTPDHPDAISLWELLKPKVEQAELLSPEHALTWPDGLP